MNTKDRIQERKDSPQPQRDLNGSNMDITMAATKICSTCLAFDVEMFSLTDDEVRGYFESAISDIKMEPDEEFMQNVCGDCLLLMKKYIEFKYKCLDANERLRQLCLQSPYISEAKLKEERIKLHSETIISSKKIPKSPDSSSFVEIASIPDTKASLSQVKQENFEDDGASRMDLGNQEENYESQADSNIHDFEVDERLADGPIIIIVQGNQNRSDIQDNVFAPNSISMESDFGEVRENQSQKDEPELVQTHKDEKNHMKSPQNKKLRGPRNKNTSLVKKKQALLKSEYAVQVTLTEEKQKEELLTSENYLNAPFKCSHCVEGFISKEEFDRHMEVHNKSHRAWQCDICKYRFCNLRRLKIHQRLHKIRYKCGTCGVIVMTHKQAILHKRQHLGIQFECEQCKAEFKNQELYKVHTRTAHPTEHVCDACGDYFTSQGELDSHKNTRDCEKSPPIVFECESCDIRFLNMPSWYGHMLKHAHDKEQNPPAECPICGHKNTSWHDWRDHILTEHHHNAGSKNPTKTFICDVCGNALANEENLAHHMRSRHNKIIAGKNTTRLRRDTCKVCNLVFQRRNMKKHMLIHNTGEKKFACDICGERFTRTATRNDHVKNVHSVVESSQVKEEAAVNAEPNIWQDACKVCSKHIYRHNMKRHMLTHTGEKPYKCDICERFFTQATSRDEHVRNIHKAGLKMETSKKQNVPRTLDMKKYECPLCPKVFRGRRDLRVHERSHTGEKAIICDICKRSFASKQSLTHHLMIHTGEKPFSCDMCDSSFSRKQTLAYHRVTHTGQIFECDTCHRVFKSKRSLDIHRRRHTEKIFSCDICQRKFATKGVLEVHQQLHTGEKGFVCDICNKKFSTRSNLRRHEYVHTSAKNWTCDLCGKSFTQSGGLKLHTNSVHLKLPYPPRKPRKRIL